MVTKRKCTATTKTGLPCNAWAVHNTEPALCSAHAKRNQNAGAPPGNQNALKHGFYTSVLTQQEAADLLAHAQNDTIEDELALTRVMLRRLLEYLQQDIPETDETAVTELLGKDALKYFNEGSRYAMIAPLVYRETRTVAYLMRQHKPSGGFQDIMDNILDDLSTELGAQL